MMVHLTKGVELTIGSTMAWSKDLVPDFDIQLPRGRKTITFVLKSTTTFTLGIIKDFLQKRAKSNSGVLEAINFLNHLFSVTPTLSLIPVARKFFTQDIAGKINLLEFRRGLFQSIQFGGQQSLSINVDVTTGIFWNSEYVTVLDLVSRILGIKNEDLTPRRLTAVHFKLLSVLKGLKYRVQHRGTEFAKRQHAISRIVQESSRDHKFHLKSNENGPSISVEQYMKSTYNIRLKYPNAVLVRKGDSTLMPMELCYIIPVPSLHASVILY
jgi:eukaryotic translation initiation factor 2C